MKYLWVSALILIADQLTKWMAEAQLELHEQNPVFPGFNLTLMYNEGAAFSLLSDAGGWQRWLFSILAIAASLIILALLKGLEQGQRLMGLALALILGGAIGNLIDRMVYGHVIDFLDVYWRQAHWPAFNIADSAICVGALLFLIDTFRTPIGTDSEPA